MTEEYLQVAFEVKATCDEISRRLLRWHWEQKPGAHSFDALLEHIERRRAESPAYYERMPDLAGKTSWQQLDTTVCMRVLLDPEQDAARPLDMLGNTAHPAAARRACNAVRTARNEAAHASDSVGAQQAAVLFSEAVEALEEGYANSALRENELERYYRRSEDFIARLSSGEADDDTADYIEDGQQPAAPAQAPAKARSKQPAAQRSGSGKKAGTAERRSGSGKKAAKDGGGRERRQRRGEDRALAIISLAAVIIGLILRARSLGA